MRYLLYYSLLVLLSLSLGCSSLNYISEQDATESQWQEVVPTTGPEQSSPHNPSASPKAGRPSQQVSSGKSPTECGHHAVASPKGGATLAHSSD